MENCGNCRILHREVGEKSARVLVLEKELATCQDYMRSQIARSEREIKIQDKNGNVLQKQLQISNAKVDSLTAEREQLSASLKETTLKCQELSKDNDRRVASETEYVKRIRELEKENLELKTAKSTRPIDNSTIEMLMERVQMLEVSQSAPTPPTPDSIVPAPSHQSLQEQIFQMTETKFTLEAYDPLSQADQLQSCFIEMSRNTDDIAHVHDKVGDFKQKYLLYTSTLDKNIDFLSLSPNPKLSDITPMPPFPDCMDADFLSHFERTVKLLKKPPPKLQPVAAVKTVSKCPICSLEIGTGPNIASCSGCQQNYHKECGRVFAEVKLGCTSTNCGRKFEGAQWL